MKVECNACIQLPGGSIKPLPQAQTSFWHYDNAKIAMVQKSDSAENLTVIVASTTGCLGGMLVNGTPLMPYLKVAHCWLPPASVS